MQQQVRRRDISRAAASKRFGRYKTEKEKTVRKADIKKDEVLKKFRAAWGVYSRENSITFEGYYELAVLVVKELQYSSRDVERFSIALTEFQDEERFSERAGAFLSALINNGKDRDYLIHTGQLDKPVERLGYRNTKNITINGDVGAQLGAHMREGSIIVEGDARNFVGLTMEGGSITVDGNAEEFVGFEMKGGRIIIEGNAGYGVGVMRGGEIHLKGDYEDEDLSKGISDGEYSGDGIYGGKIFHKGKLIVDK